MPLVLVSDQFRKLAWRRILLIAAGAGLVGFCSSFLIPPTYEARSSFIPIRELQRSPRLAPGGLGDVAASLGISGSSFENPAVTYPEILRSRTIIESVLVKPVLDLRRRQQIVYLDHLRIRQRDHAKRIHNAIEIVRRRMRVLYDRKNDVLFVSLEDKNPYVAAAVVNNLVLELQRYNLASRALMAHQNRMFIEERKGETQVLLSLAESALTAFRERNLRIGNSPQLLLEQERLVRNVRIQEEVYLTLMKEYELAKIDENRSAPLIRILDSAKPPPVKSSPRRGLITFLASTSLLTVMVGIRFLPRSAGSA